MNTGVFPIRCFLDIAMLHGVKMNITRLTKNPLGIEISLI
jgi:hypothetical protein